MARLQTHTSVISQNKPSHGRSSKANVNYCSAATKTTATTTAAALCGSGGSKQRLRLSAVSGILSQFHKCFIVCIHVCEGEESLSHTSLHSYSMSARKDPDLVITDSKITLNLRLHQNLSRKRICNVCLCQLRLTKK